MASRIRRARPRRGSGSSNPNALTRNRPICDFLPHDGGEVPTRKRDDVLSGLRHWCSVHQGQHVVPQNGLRGDNARTGPRWRRSPASPQCGTRSRAGDAQAVSCVGTRWQVSPMRDHSPAHPCHPLSTRLCTRPRPMETLLRAAVRLPLIPDNLPLRVVRLWGFTPVYNRRRKSRRERTSSRIRPLARSVLTVNSGSASSSPNDSP